jgi:hypothetical protein
VVLLDDTETDEEVHRGRSTEEVAGGRLDQEEGVEDDRVSENRERDGKYRGIIDNARSAFLPPKEEIIPAVPIPSSGKRPNATTKDYFLSALESGPNSRVPAVHLGLTIPTIMVRECAGIAGRIPYKHVQVPDELMEQYPSYQAAMAFEKFSKDAALDFSVFITELVCALTKVFVDVVFKQPELMRNVGNKKTLFDLVFPNFARTRGAFNQANGRNAVSKDVSKMVGRELFFRGKRYQTSAVVHTATLNCECTLEVDNHEAVEAYHDLIRALLSTKVNFGERGSYPAHADGDDYMKPFLGECVLNGFMFHAGVVLSDYVYSCSKTKSDEEDNEGEDDEGEDDEGEDDEGGNAGEDHEEEEEAEEEDDGDENNKRPNKRKRRRSEHWEVGGWHIGVIYPPSNKKHRKKKSK